MLGYESRNRMNIGKAKNKALASIELNGDEIASAIDLWLEQNDVKISGSRTIYVDGKICKDVRASVDVDPSGYLIYLNQKTE